MKGRWKALDALVVLAVPILLVAFNVRMLLTDAYTRWGLERVTVPSGLSSEQRDSRGEVIAHFVSRRVDVGVVSIDTLSTALMRAGSPRSDLERRVLLYGYGPLLAPTLSKLDAEIDHLKDVRNALLVLDIAALVAVLGIAIASLRTIHHREGGILLRRLLARGGLLTLALVALVGIGIATGWERTFVLFHQILFPQGNWAFPAESLLIQIFPNQFWFESAAALVALTTVEAMALVWWGGRGNVPTRSKPERCLPAAADGSP